ncbi:MAG: hypothetical protein C4525_00120 [Desulfarculus sp.]|jgi:hypothetical protein|nr:MAG: hypothetical protein C4525_00120 [Desulfarculus sp.]
MSKALYFIYAGGVLHAGWAVFHFFFPRIFQWPQRLAGLDSVNRSIMQVLNLCLTFYFAVAAYLSLAFAPELLAGPLGKKLLAIFTAFWLLRLGLQFRFFKAAHPASLVLILFFILTMAAYAYPLLQAGR